MGARGALMLRLTLPTSTPMLPTSMLLMLMLLSSAPLLPTPTSTFLPQLPPMASPNSTSVRLMPMLRPDTTVDTMATMPTATESRSAIIKLYTKVFFKKCNVNLIQADSSLQNHTNLSFEESFGFLRSFNARPLVKWVAPSHHRFFNDCVATFK